MKQQDGRRTTATLIGGGRATRRGFLVGSGKLIAGSSLAAALAGRGIRAGSAQGTPAAAMAYPELKVTISVDKLDLSANSVPAGYVLLTVVNQTKDATSAGVIGPGPGQTMQGLMQAAATPVPSNGFPPFIYKAAIPGGPGNIPAGGTGQAVIKLGAGDWVVFPEGNQAPVFLTAVAGTPASQKPPATTVIVIEHDFAFTGLERPITPGKQTWQVINEGVQPHMLVLAQVPATTTIDQVLLSISTPDNATPPPGALRQSDFQDRGGVILQSAGAIVWPLLDLTAGRYVAACFVTDPTTGKLHAMEGMLSLLNVGAGGTPTP